MFGAWLTFENPQYKPTKEDRKRHHDNIKGVCGKYRYRNTKQFKQIEHNDLQRMKMIGRQYIIDTKHSSSGCPPFDFFTIYHSALVNSYTPQSFIIHSVDKEIDMKRQLFIQNEYLREFQRRTKIEFSVLKNKIERLENAQSVNKQKTVSATSNNNKKYKNIK
jgi:hypothetical protein